MAKTTAAKKLQKSSAPAGLRLEYVPLGQIQGAKRNPKKHLESALLASLERFGMGEVPMVDERTGRLVAGHGRVQALRALLLDGKPAPRGIRPGPKGEWLIPVLRGWQSRSDTEADGYLLASNQTTIAGGWDETELAKLLQELDGAQALDGLGFASEDVDRLLRQLERDAEPVDVDEVPEPPAESWVKLGDMFELDGHRIICGDSTDAAVVDRLMAGEHAEISWTDPPWNVAYGENTNPAGWSNKHAPIANDNLGDKFPAFCSGFVTQIARASKPGAPLYLAMSAQEWPVIHASLLQHGFKWSSTIIWAKDSLVLSRKDYHTQYEPIWYGWLGTAARIHPVKDRTQSDLWSIPRPKRSDEHPTMKPVELVARSIENSSKRGAIVFEPFSGSGTTLIACEQTGRRARCIELEPRYVQVALERWEKLTGRKARKL